MMSTFLPLHKHFFKLPPYVRADQPPVPEAEKDRENHGFTAENQKRLAEELISDPELGCRSRVVLPFTPEGLALAAGPRGPLQAQAQVLAKAQVQAQAQAQAHALVQAQVQAQAHAQAKAQAQAQAYAQAQTPVQSVPQTQPRNRRDMRTIMSM